MTINITCTPEEFRKLLGTDESKIVITEQPKKEEKQHHVVLLNAKVSETKTEKTHKEEIPKQPKKPKTQKQKADIEAIKAAYYKLKGERKDDETEQKQEKPEGQRATWGGRRNYRSDIDDSLIVYMRDEQGMTIEEIARALKCSNQTISNRYRKAKGEKE